MSFGNDFDRPPAISQSDKHGVAQESLSGGDGKAGSHNPVHGVSPKFHKMSIMNAANGSIIEHDSHDSAHPGPHTSKKILIPHDHPMAHHVNALAAHAESLPGDCPGEKKGPGPSSAPGGGY